jgi:poly(A) polymerase
VRTHPAPLSRLDAPWLERGDVADLLAVLNRDGEEARVIGGAVRNALLARLGAEEGASNIGVAEHALGDVDIATTAIPEEVIKRVEAAGFKAVPTGIDHGTITVVISGKPFEVTTLREDVETYGRKAKVAFGRDWKADAERRDFTINALSVSPDGMLHDYVGGLTDLAARRVRFIGDPEKRIAEDYLRILRFFRFHAAYGQGAPDAAGLHACVVARSGLDALSRERVRMEILKLLLAPHAVATLVVMEETGLLGRLLAGVPLLASFANMLKVEAALGLAGDPVRRLAALGTRVVEDAERLWQRLRLANAEHERLQSMAIQWRGLSPAIGEPGARSLLYQLGPGRFVDRVLIAWTRSPAPATDASWHRLATLPLRWTAPAFPLRATDFMARGIRQGPALGAALRVAEAAWIEADFPSDPAALAAIADRATNG